MLLFSFILHTVQTLGLAMVAWWMIHADVEPEYSRVIPEWCAPVGWVVIVASAVCAAAQTFDDAMRIVAATAGAP